MVDVLRRVQYAISASVKIRRRKRSPYCSMVAAMRSISVASRPSPMMFDTRLPQPNHSFRWVQVGSGPALICPPLEPFVHIITSRSWRLGSGDADEGPAWREVQEAMGCPLVR